MDNELLTSPDAILVKKLSDELQAVCGRNKWPSVSLVMLTQHGTNVFIGHGNVDGSMYDALQASPQGGSALVNSVQIVSAAMQGNLPRAFVAGVFANFAQELEKADEHFGPPTLPTEEEE